MRRVASNRNPAVDKFGAGKPGFKAGNPQTGEPATTPGFEWFDSLQEELASFIEAMGLTLDPNDNTQLQAAIRALMRGKVTVNVAGGASVTLTAAQYNLPILVLTGVLTANINLVFPAISGAWIVRNQTSGNFTVTCKTAAGTGVVLSQGCSNALFGDGTNIYAEQTDWASIQAQTATAFTSAGVAPSFTFTPSPALTAYAAGQRFRVKFNAAGAGTDTLNVSGLGAKSIKQYDGAGNKVAPVIVANQLADLEYDGADFVILDPLPTVIRQIQPITASVAANALALTLNPTSLDFRANALNSGAINTRSVGAAISLTVPSGATLGTINGQAARLALLAIDNAGTVELAVTNLAGGVNLDETTLISTTAISAAASSASAIYSTTARNNVPFRVVGFIDITEATAGVWASAPTVIQGVGGLAGAAMSSIGYGQTWQPVNRQPGVAYYNITGRPIVLLVSASGGSASVFVDISINGGASIRFCATQSLNGGTSAAGDIIIPAGAFYVLTDTNVVTRNSYELR